jgi:peptide/nickel transport system permease protein
MGERASAVGSQDAPVTTATARDVAGPEAVRTLMRRPSFVIGAVVVLWWAVVAITWRWWGIDPFGDSGQALAPPSSDQWLGTDRLGRSVLARVLAGSEPVLVVAPLGTLLATVLGTVLGLVAGFRRGWVDHLLSRVFDILLIVPAIILLLVVVTAFGDGPLVLSVAIGVLFAPSIARVVRAQVLVELGKDYVTNARLQGESAGRILFRELLPNVWPQVIVQATLALAAAVFVASSLSFLGLAAAPPSPDWGLAVSENRAYLQGAWWTLVFPCLAIASLVVSVNVVGDHLKEVLR